MDGATAFRSATETALPQAAICYDPFHIMQWTNRALDEVFSAAVATNRDDFNMSSGQWRKARTALRTGAERLKPDRQELLDTITAQNHDIGAAWRLKEQLRQLFRIRHPHDPRATYTAGSNAPETAESAHSSTSPAAWNTTTTASSPPSSSASPTDSSKASTPRSA